MAEAAFGQDGLMLRSTGMCESDPTKEGSLSAENLVRRQQLFGAVRLWVMSGETVQVANQSQPPNPETDHQ